MAPTQPTPEERQYQAERERILFRRDALGLASGHKERQSPHIWGLALSGGGIRSATFCLGVLQALARAKPPVLKDDEKQETASLLQRFDYLSTVSGGGYIGAFFSSLFQPGRLRDQACPVSATLDAACKAQARKAAEDACEVLRYEPPGRITTRAPEQGQSVGKGPSAWLRENGRYLTPTGSGDMFYALAMTWRNWLSLHFVIGMPLLWVLALITLAKGMLDPRLFALSIGLVMLAPLPFVLAFWLAIPGKALDEPPAFFNPCSMATVAVAAVLAACGFASLDRFVATLCLGATAFIGISLLIFALLLRLLKTNSATNEDDGLNANNIRNYRIHITRWQATAIIVSATLVALAFVVTLADILYGEIFNHLWKTAVSAGLLPVLIWLVRHLAWLKDEKPLPDWLLKLPLNALALVGGVLMALLLCVVWALFAHWIAWDGQAPAALPLQPAAIARLLGLLALTALLTAVSSRFIGFLNVSSFQGFYSARLARAYLGASNGQRFNGTDEQRKQRMSVAEALSKDDIALDRYYGTPTAGPLHLINVTMNLTVDPAEQLVQRDRKGKPLCVAPGWLPVSKDAQGAPAASFILDGKPYRRDAIGGLNSELKYSLTLGQWVGTSGAALSTGLGRATNLGLSLVLGLANIRLGTWWPSNFMNKDEQAYQRKDTGLPRWFPTQTYLFYEFTAHFHGHRRDYQYLSDGGHFENTAAYELLRPERGIELIVLCDCGCDPRYQFDDLANLVRLARIDQSLEIEEDPGVLANYTLETVFGSIREFQQPLSPGSDKCALLFNVSRRRSDEEVCAGKERLELISRILVLKPRLISSLAPDVLNYAGANADFPNQTTADQFFDEAQFESYRQLGLGIGEKIFGDINQSNSIANELWKYLKI
ncbi:patatin-like phospholipase family protein [Pseudomonas moorei]|uniref:patatin-like phospholipase family protein n=1 Tax=Pseudomonas moorei TaxID=395599 RepID=UPI001FF646FF|nr:patatin-like phospholipase family protein [Pseudomonas moorei]